MGLQVHAGMKRVRLGNRFPPGLPPGETRDEYLTVRVRALGIQLGQPAKRRLLPEGDISIPGHLVNSRERVLIATENKYKILIPLAVILG